MPSCRGWRMLQVARCSALGQDLTNGTRWEGEPVDLSGFDEDEDEGSSEAAKPQVSVNLEGWPHECGNKMAETAQMGLLGPVGPGTAVEKEPLPAGPAPATVHAEAGVVAAASGAAAAKAVAAVDLASEDARAIGRELKEAFDCFDDLPPQGTAGAARPAKSTSSGRLSQNRRAIIRGLAPQHRTDLNPSRRGRIEQVR
jgi:hypothetical protein